MCCGGWRGEGGEGGEGVWRDNKSMDIGGQKVKFAAIYLPLSENRAAGNPW